MIMKFLFSFVITLCLHLLPFHVLVAGDSINDNDFYGECPSVAATEGLPSGIVNNTVCVISGEYVDHDVDVCLQGPEPLVFQRSYCSTPKHRNMGLGWSHNQRGMAASTTSFDEDDDDEPIYLTCVTEPSGSYMTYKAPKGKKVDQPPVRSYSLIRPKGLTNGFQNEIVLKLIIKTKSWF